MLYTISVLVFFFVLALLIYKNRSKLEFRTIIVIWRTKHFRNLIDVIARAGPRFWKALATIGIVCAFIAMFYGTFILLTAAHSIYTGLIKEPALKLILPTIEARTAVGPGYLLIPFWFWLFIIAAILIPHELMHGIVARAEKIKLKSVGLLLLAIFPGAFVEPDEKQLKRSKISTQLRVFAAGSFANFLVAAFIFAFTAYIIWPTIASEGLILANVTPTSPAAVAGLEPGEMILYANGKPVRATYFEYLAGKGYLYEEIGELFPGKQIILASDKANYTIRAAKDPQTNKTYIGITYKPQIKQNYLLLVYLFTMIWLLSIAVGLINILPIYPLDGGLILEALSKKVFGRRARRITLALTYFFITILIFDFIGPWIIPT